MTPTPVDDVPTAFLPRTERLPISAVIITRDAADRIEEVLAAKMRIRVRQEYGSIVAMILVGVMINIIVKLVTEWWFSAMSHRVLMEGWHKNALEAARVQAEEKAR